MKKSLLLTEAIYRGTPSEPAILQVAKQMRETLQDPTGLRGLRLNRYPAYDRKYIHANRNAAQNTMYHKIALSHDHLVRDKHYCWPQDGGNIINLLHAYEDAHFKNVFLESEPNGFKKRNVIMSLAATYGSQNWC